MSTKFMVIVSGESKDKAQFESVVASLHRSGATVLVSDGDKQACAVASKGQSLVFHLDGDRSDDLKLRLKARTRKMISVIKGAHRRGVVVFGQSPAARMMIKLAVINRLPVVVFEGNAPKTVADQCVTWKPVTSGAFKGGEMAVIERSLIDRHWFVGIDGKDHAVDGDPVLLSKLQMQARPATPRDQWSLRPSIDENEPQIMLDKDGEFADDDQVPNVEYVSPMMGHVQIKPTIKAPCGAIANRLTRYKATIGHHDRFERQPSVYHKASPIRHRRLTIHDFVQREMDDEVATLRADCGIDDWDMASDEDKQEFESLRFDLDGEPTDYDPAFSGRWWSSAADKLEAEVFGQATA